MLTAQERRLAELFCRLSAIYDPRERMTKKHLEQSKGVSPFLRSIDDSIRSAKEQLLDTLERAGLDDLPPRELRRIEREFLSLSTRRISIWSGKQATQRELLRTQLPNLTKVVRHTLKDLFDGKVVRRDASVGLQLREGIVHATEISEPRTNELEYEFYSLLEKRPFPFGHCPACGRFFVRVKRQKYCSAGCKSKVTESARKDTRRVYMRAYMANRRKKARKGRET